MHRRQVLAALGTSPLLGGCLAAPGTDPGIGAEPGAESATDTPPTPEGIHDVAFTLGWPTDRDRLEPEHVHAADATVASRVPPRVRVVGQLASGSRSCKETSLGAVDYDGRTLEFTVVDEHVAGPTDPCTTELAVIGYELRVTFADTPPASVAVTHPGNGRFHETIALR